MRHERTFGINYRQVGDLPPVGGELQRATIRLLLSVPDDWHTVNGTLTAGAMSFDINKNVRYLVKKNYGIELVPGIDGLVETALNVFTDMSPRAFPVAVTFRDTGYSIASAKKMIAAILKRGFIGHIIFERRLQDLLNEVSDWCAFSIPDPRNPHESSKIKLGWDDNCGGGPKHLEPIERVIAELDCRLIT